MEEQQLIFHTGRTQLYYESRPSEAINHLKATAENESIIDQFYT